ncbi:MAG TPA: hypothetical protein VGB73_03850 [Pyrinomonadaceae bacterium]
MKRFALLLSFLSLSAAAALLCPPADTSLVASAQQPTPPRVARDLSGSYRIASSSNPGGGGSYEGKVNIARQGGSWNLVWMIPGSVVYKGVGLQLDDTLAVGWGMGEDYGVAAYRIAAGRLDGIWTSADERGAVGAEVLEGSANLNGTYRIVKGLSANGERRYSGTVSITPKGEVYSVKWRLTQETYDGVGIRQGNLFIVGWGQAGKGAGVVAYRIAPRALQGRWATPEDTRLGTENLVISTQ